MVLWCVELISVFHAFDLLLQVRLGGTNLEKVRESLSLVANHIY